MTLQLLHHAASTHRTTDLADHRFWREPASRRAGHGVGAGVGTGVGTVDRPETGPRTDPAATPPQQLTAPNQPAVSGPDRPRRGLLMEGVAHGR
jgi:hypothetical protein